MEDNTQFKKILDEHHQWPCPYIFKFIVPTENLPLFLQAFPDEKIGTRESKTGKYTSITFESKMCSSEEVMSVYNKASEIPGVMSL